MKWKLKQSEFNALYAIIEQILFAKWDTDIYTKLLQTLLTKTYVRLYKMKVHSQSRYSVKLPDEECLSLYECCVVHGLGNETFEGNLLNKIIADIDQHFAVNNSLEIVETKIYKTKI
jgi:hypothetical protein